MDPRRPLSRGNGSSAGTLVSDCDFSIARGWWRGPLQPLATLAPGPARSGRSAWGLSFSDRLQTSAYLYFEELSCGKLRISNLLECGMKTEPPFPDAVGGLANGRMLHCTRPRMAGPRLLDKNRVERSSRPPLCHLAAILHIDDGRASGEYGA